MLGKLQLICALGVVLYTGFIALRAQRQRKPIKAKALAALGVLGVVAVFVLPALIKATLYAFFFGITVLAVLVIGGYVALRMLQRKKGRSELT